MERLASLVDETLHAHWSFNPAAATFDGVRGYDHTLGDFSPEALSRHVRVLRGIHSRLKDLRLKRGSPEELDARLIEGYLRSQAADIERYNQFQRDPDLYPAIAVNALYGLFLKELPAAYRKEMVRSRLSEVPRLLHQGVRNLRRPDRVMTDVGIQRAASAVPFIRERVRSLDPGGADATVCALESYIRFLKRDVLPRSGRTYPIGRSLFDHRLRFEHGLPYDSRELYAIGRELVAGLQSEMRRLARRMGGRDWRSLIERLKGDHPSARGLVKHYQDEYRKARSFCRRKGLVSLPKGERVRVVPTPRFEWGTIPYAAMVPPGAFDRRCVSEIWVTPIDPKAPASKRKQQLQGHCVWGIPVVVVHEGYPGHHVQLARLRSVRSKARKVLPLTVSCEGWAHYCEQLMEEAGYWRDDRIRLFRLKEQLWRACRIVVDVGLHARGWTFKRAVDYMVREALVERPNAEAEVKRYCSSATYQMAYTMGKLEILKLRSAAKQRWGKRFTLRRFHDWLLSRGSVPPSWLEP